jgi:hypothetical protein
MLCLAKYLTDDGFEAYFVFMLDRQSHRVRRPRAHVRPSSQRAFEDLRYIRETMERSSAFTATPGWGQVFMGVTAVVAAAIAAQYATAQAWLTTWLAEALIAVAIAVTAMQLKARRAGLPLTSGPGRKFALEFLPCVLVAGLLTAALTRLGLMRLLPGVWMLLYGAAVITGGAFSIPLLPAMGSCFLFAGTVAVFVPAWGNLLMATTFGGLHIFFGLWIAREYGG